MFDAEKLLGALLGSGLNRQGADLGLDNLGKMGNLGGLGDLGGMGGKAAVGMGVLGIAIAAYEHWQGQRDQGQTVSAGASPSRPPPPPAPAPGGTTPPPPPPAAIDAYQQEAKLYLRGMIAAASADGVIDGPEREHILNQLEGAGLDSAERAFILAEMDHPATIAALMDGVRDSQQGFRLYLSALLAIRVDSDAERAFLRELGTTLRIPAETLAAVHQRYGVEL